MCLQAATTNTGQVTTLKPDHHLVFWKTKAVEATAARLHSDLTSKHHAAAASTKTSGSVPVLPNLSVVC